ncbi:MAG: hypothetical protein K2I79_02860 [Clostridia bacterium]|nr:hypothetical protein [Clostridia bacterium]
MKKLLPIITLILVAALILLCACSPSASQVQEMYKGRGYTIQPFDYDSADIDKGVAEFVFSAVKGMTTGDVKCVFVISFKDGDDAKRYELLHSMDTGKENLVRKGKLIVYGDYESVQILVG